MNRLLPLPKKIIVAAFILAVCIALPLIAAPKVSDERQKLIDYGLTFQGTRYVYGGSKPESGFDVKVQNAPVRQHALNMPIRKKDHV